NHDEKKVSLGIKQIWDDPWYDLLDRYAPGAVVEEVTVLSNADYGVFVRIVPGIDALIPNSEIPDDLKPRRGDVLRAEVSNVDTSDRRINMTLKDVGQTPAAERFNTMRREAAAASRGGTLGDLLKEKLGDKLKSL